MNSARAACEAVVSVNTPVVAAGAFEAEDAEDASACDAGVELAADANDVEAEHTMAEEEAEDAAASDCEFEGDGEGVFEEAVAAFDLELERGVEAADAAGQDAAADEFEVDVDDDLLFPFLKKRMKDG